MKHSTIIFIVLSTALFPCISISQVYFTDPVSSNLSTPLVQLEADNEITTFTIVAPSLSSGLKTELMLPLEGGLGAEKIVLSKSTTIGLTYIQCLQGSPVAIKPLVGMALGPFVSSWRFGVNMDFISRIFFQIGMHGNWTSNDSSTTNKQSIVEGILVLQMTPASSIELSTSAPARQQASYLAIITYKLASNSNIGLGLRFDPDGHTARSLSFNINF